MIRLQASPLLSIHIGQMNARHADLIEVKRQLLNDIDLPGDLESCGLAGVQHSHHLLGLPLLIPHHLLHTPSYLHAHIHRLILLLCAHSFGLSTNGLVFALVCCITCLLYC